MINSEFNFTLEEILPKFPKEFQEKIKHSVELLRKAEKLALAYSAGRRLLSLVQRREG